MAEDICTRRASRRHVGFQVHSGMLNDYTTHKMSAAEFCRQFDAAVRGEPVYLSKFVRPWHGRPNAQEWTKLRRAVFVRDDFTCTYCGERARRLECDHIVAVSRGGSNDMDNLTTACRPCNRAKRDKTVSEWRG